MLIIVFVIIYIQDVDKIIENINQHVFKCKVEVDLFIKLHNIHLIVISKNYIQPRK